ncbi:MAG: DUF1800 family protein, partial [Pseudomonadota bacterium]
GDGGDGDGGDGDGGDGDGGDGDGGDGDGGDGDGGDGDGGDAGPQAALSLALTPSAEFVLEGDIALSAVMDGDTLPARGATLFGVVSEPLVYDAVTASVQPSGRTAVVDIGITTGQFAVRLFPEDLPEGGQVTLALSASSSSDDTIDPIEASYSFYVAPAMDGLELALGRISFGATAESYQRVQEIGFDAYVIEQLDPDSIDDSAFESSNPEDVLNPNASGNSILGNYMAYNVNYAAMSEKQLLEVMTYFWSNHFHAIPKDNSAITSELTEWQGYRSLAMTSFLELLRFSAENPNMMAYLENENSTYNNLNQNYARELLELHTVGVNGGYGDDDIDPVARVFTGWGRDRIDGTNPQEDIFVFEAQQFRDNGSLRRQLHDPDDKYIPFIDVTIIGRADQEGFNEGLELLEILSRLPQTRDFVCGKLATYLVSDMPDQKYITACDQAWADTDGSVQAFVAAIVQHPDYLTDVTIRRNKVKTPYEFAVSYLRNFASGYAVTGDSNFRGFLQHFHDGVSSRAGMNFNFFPVPTGFSEVSASWVGTGTLIEEQRNIIRPVRDSQTRDNIAFDMLSVVTDAGLETAEEVAAYLLGIAAIENYSGAEFESLVAELKGSDGVFSPFEDEDDARTAMRRALGLLVSMPSFKLQ